MLVPEGAAVEVEPGPQYVSRGGEKLAGALEAFQLDVKGLVAVDVGASTGGFTDCLLRNGAARVYAIDVGYGLIDYRLRQDPRVSVLERVNIRYLESLPEKADLATIDVSFISLEKVIPTVTRLLKTDSRIVALVKPQFEAKRQEVGKRGVVRDPQVHAAVLGRHIAWGDEAGLAAARTDDIAAAGAGGQQGILRAVANRKRQTREQDRHRLSPEDGGGARPRREAARIALPRVARGVGEQGLGRHGCEAERPGHGPRHHRRRRWHSARRGAARRPVRCAAAGHQSRPARLPDRAA